jgi:hypothetical protein
MAFILAGIVGGAISTLINNNLKKELTELLHENSENEIAGNIYHTIGDINVGSESSVGHTMNDDALVYFHTHVRPLTTYYPSGIDMEIFLKSNKPEIVVHKTGIAIYEPTDEFIKMNKDYIKADDISAYYQAIKMLVEDEMITKDQYIHYFKNIDWEAINDIIEKTIEKEGQSFKDYMCQDDAKKFHVEKIVEYATSSLPKMNAFNIEIIDLNTSS